MIEKLRGKAILKGTRGKAGTDIGLFAEVVARVSALVNAAPEITEMDLNPLLGNEDSVTAVDARISIEKNNSQR